MATRNRTREFKTFRDGFDRTKGYKPLPGAEQAQGQAQRGYDPNGPPRPTQIAGAGAAGSLPPFWVDTFDKVNKTVSDIETTIDKLAEAHKNRLMVRFDDDSDKARDQEIDMLTGTVTKKFREAERLLKQVGTSDGKPQEGGEDERVRLNMQKALAMRLQDLSFSFRAKQKKYLEDVQKQKKGKSFIFDEDEEAPASSKKSGIALSNAEAMMLEEETVNLAERDVEIQRIAKNIEELAVIFKELATLVIDQGTIFDRIDMNLENATVAARHGVEQLVKAREHQKQAVPERCVLILVLIVFVELVIIAFKHS